MSNTIAILEGNTFVVSDTRGDIEGTASETVGLFAADTRFLSRWVLTVNGIRPNMLSTDDVQYFEAQFFLAVTSGTVYVDAELTVFRRRTVDRGFDEELTFMNHSSKP